MTKRILVATDLSESSSEALRQGDALAAASGAELSVCHVLPYLLGVSTLFPQRNAENALRIGNIEGEVRRAVEAQVAACMPRRTAEVFIARGSEYAGVLHRAEEWTADLIVVGSQGRTGLPRVLLGSVAERILRHANCAVLVARPTLTRGVVLVATDLSDPSMPAVAAGAVEARRRKAKLVVLHVVEFGSIEVTLEEIIMDLTGRDEGWNIDKQVRTSLEGKITRALTQCHADGEPKVVDGVPAAAVVKAADSLGAELVVIGTRGRTGLVRIALGSTAERIARTSACSVLAVRLGGT